MPNYKYETDKNSPAYTPGRGGNRIQGITIHHWGADGQTHDGVVAYLTRPGANTSAHYVVSSGRVTCIVDPDDTAWHAGNWNANLTHIGIECRPEMSAGDFETVAELVAELRAAYGNLPLRPHSQFTSTACPGRWRDQLARLSDRANEIKTGGGAATPVVSKPQTPARSNDVETLAWETIHGRYGTGEARKKALGGMYDAVQARVNEIVLGKRPSQSAPNISALADAVLRGEYGNGEQRKAMLGGLYDQVQAEVNRKLGAAPSAPAPNISALADAVLRGDYGNGDERRRRLGNLYDAVQAEVNRRYA